MQRIETSDSQFHDGDPINGTLGTVVTAAFLNNVQEELAKAIEAYTALNPADSGQLAKIITARRKNYIINGNFYIWQRGTSFAATTTAQYLADRFKNSMVGSTTAASQQAFTVGQGVVPNEPTLFHRSVVASVANSVNNAILYQSIESVRTLAGKTATLSFWAKADASRNIAIEMSQNFGTGGSPSAAVTGIGVTTIPLTASWQKFTATVQIPTLSGKTVGTNGDHALSLNFWFDAGSSFNSRTNSLGQQSGTFDIAQVQLEEGSVATNFEYRPIAQELALCQRYYETGDVSITTYGTSVQSFRVPFMATKRTVPTLTSYSWTYVNASGGNVSSPSLRNFNASVTVTTTGNVGWTAGWTADAEL